MLHEEAEQKLKDAEFRAMKISECHTIEMARLVAVNEKLSAEIQSKATALKLFDTKARYFDEEVSRFAAQNQQLQTENTKLKAVLQTNESAFREIEEKNSQILRDCENFRERVEAEKSQTLRELHSRIDLLARQNSDLIDENSRLHAQKPREAELLREVRDMKDELDEARFSIRRLLSPVVNGLDGFTRWQFVDVIRTQQQQLADSEMMQRNAQRSMKEAAVAMTRMKAETEELRGRLETKQ
jgi:hypothetical protein